jgi:hypothetical protein
MPRSSTQHLGSTSNGWHTLSKCYTSESFHFISFLLHTKVDIAERILIDTIDPILYYYWTFCQRWERVHSCWYQLYVCIFTFKFETCIHKGVSGSFKARQINSTQFVMFRQELDA